MLQQQAQGAAPRTRALTPTITNQALPSALHLTGTLQNQEAAASQVDPQTLERRKDRRLLTSLLLGTVGILLFDSVSGVWLGIWILQIAVLVFAVSVGGTLLFFSLLKSGGKT
jgi:hypothetical protein